MARCDFCGARIDVGTGKKYVKKDGKVLDFCSMKCEKNLIKLKRKPHNTKWTLAFAKQKRQASETTEKAKKK